MKTETVKVVVLQAMMEGAKMVTQKAKMRVQEMICN
jgi:hypothetical protein